jgi:translocation and assembly module TamB
MEKFVKKSTTAALFLSPAFFVSLFCLAWVYGVKPKLKEWVFQKLPEINSMQPYVNIQFKDIDISLLKLQFKIDDVQISFQKNKSSRDINLEFLSNIEIKSVKGQVDLFSLMVGEISLSNVTFDQINTAQDLSELLKLRRNDSAEFNDLNLKPVFDLAENIPVQKLSFQNSQLDLSFDDQIHDTLRRSEIRIKNLTFSQKRRRFFVDSDDIKVLIKNQMQTSALLEFNLKAQVSEKDLTVDQFELRHGSSDLKLSLSTKDLPHLISKPKTKSNLKVSLKLDEIKNFIYLFKQQSQRLPQLSGIVQFSGEFITDDIKKNSGLFNLSTEEVRFENLKFGNAKAQAQIKDSRLFFDSVLLEHPSGRAELKQISIQKEKPFDFKADVKVYDFQLQKLFSSLNLTNIPADFKADAEAHCNGQIVNFSVHCDTQISAEKISVKTDLKSDFHIVQIEKARAKGFVDLDLKDVKFKADLNIGQSTIASAGIVDFKTGFDMQFNSKNLNLSEIQNISNLGLKGRASGELKTWGDSSAGLIESKLQINDLIIDHFALGKIQTNLKYEKAKLSFLKNTAVLNKTNYSGDVELDFNTSEILGTLNMSTLSVEDILFAIEDRWHLPVEGLGLGFGQIHFSGPFDFWKMKYQLKTEFQRGHIMKETFSKLVANLDSDGEKINFANVIFSKPQGSVKVSNFVQTKPYNQTPEFNLNLKSQGLRIEDLDHVTKYFSSANGLNGFLILNGTVTSDILNPHVKIQMQTKDLKIDTYPLPTSQGDLQLSLNDVGFSGQIFGRQLQLDFLLPLREKKQNQFFIKAQARDFNPLTLLPLISLPLPASDTTASLTADVDLKTNSANFSNLAGMVKIENLWLQRSTQLLKLKNPSVLQFNQGLEKMTPLELSGSEQNIKIGLKNGSTSDLFIDGRFFLRPLQFLVPFSENISGLAEISCLIDLKSKNLNLSGEGLIDSASFSMKGFKYPINDINAFFDFSKSKIIFSEINATLNQANINGSGQIDLKGPQNVEVKVSAQTEKIDLEFPPQYQTSGKADIQFYGNWLPYNLKINYLIDQGNITKEFTDEDQDSVLSLRPSPFLPAQQLNQKNQSLILDVTTDFSKGVAVKNKILEGIASGQMHVTGSPENPILEGRIDIQTGSRLIFKDKPFDIQLGHVTFNGDYVINPILFINANSRVSDYDINLLIQGPVRSLDIRPTSQPSLSREDIFSLLALGYTSSKNDQALSSDAQQKQTGLEVLAALSNQSQLNKKLQEKLGLNVQLSPSIDSTRNIAVPKVTVSKKITSKITTSYSRPLTGDQQENELRLQYLLTKNLSFILNYQNQTTSQQSNILQNNNTDTGIGGIDFEFKKEFGE